MQVKNMVSSSGNSVSNQFIITEMGGGALGNFIKRETFQSYESIIAIKTMWGNETDVVLDRDAWDFSVTTGKYRNLFLNETIKETRQKIADGIYKLANLN